jgi:hypothetical protein
MRVEHLVPASAVTGFVDTVVVTRIVHVTPWLYSSADHPGNENVHILQHHHPKNLKNLDGIKLTFA